jgi:hypothetical protein
LPLWLPKKKKNNNSSVKHTKGFFLMAKFAKVVRFQGIFVFPKKITIFRQYFPTLCQNIVVGFFYFFLLSSLTHTQIWLITLVDDLPLWLHHKIETKI